MKKGNLYFKIGEHKICAPVCGDNISYSNGDYHLMLELCNLDMHRLFVLLIEHGISCRMHKGVISFFVREEDMEMFSPYAYDSRLSVDGLVYGN